MTYKIMHVVRPAQGGIKRHLEVLFQGLNRTRYRLYLAAPSDGDLISSLEPFAHKVFPVPIAEGWNPNRDWRIVRSLKNVMQQEKIDLVHTHGVRAGILGQAAALLAGKPSVVATVHNSQDPRAPFFMAFSLIQAFQYRFTVDHIITVSAALRDEARRYQRMPATKITVIYNGIDPEAYLQPSSLSRLTLKLFRNLPVVGTVARLESRKGIRFLIEAILLVDKEYGPAYFLIVGDGPERVFLEDLVKQMGLEERVIFTGFRSDIPQLLPHMDVVVIPSIQEGLSIFCLEALAAKRPIVASNTGGIPEIIRDGETGLLVTPSDPAALAQGIVKILQDRELAGKLASRGHRLVVGEFTQREMLRKTEQIYEKVFSARKDTGGK